MDSYTHTYRRVSLKLRISIPGFASQLWSISFKRDETKSKSTHINARTSDRFLAAGTEGTLGGVIVDLTVRLSFMLKVVPSGEGHFTHLGEGREATK